MLNIFTRREKIVVGLFLVLLLAFCIFPALLNPDYEILYMLLIVVPVGLLIATDPERLNVIKDK
jgi:hypothetical protein